MCKSNVTNLQKIFDLVSKNLAQNEKHFKGIHLFVQKSQGETELVFNQNSLADLTFNEIYAEGFTKLSTNAFIKLGSTLKLFICSPCEIANSPPNYDVWKSLTKLTQTNTLSIDLDVNEIPSNAFQSVNQSQLNSVRLTSKQNLIIKSNTFLNLNNLNQVTIESKLINRIEKNAFRFDKELNTTLTIEFSNTILSGDSYENGTFDGIFRPLSFRFWFANIDYIPESTFKSILNDKRSSIVFAPAENSFIDCEDCRNQWLITNNKDNQVESAFCKGKLNNKLFDSSIKTRLSIKCKSKFN